MERNRYPRRGQPYPASQQYVQRVQSQGDNCLCVNQPISFGISYVKNQPFGNLYTPGEGWHIGTIFADLDKPYCGGGARR